MRKVNIPGNAGRGRAIYDAVAAKYPNARKNGIIITQSYLRMDTAALGTQGVLSFAMGANEPVGGATSIGAQERRLSLNDNFLATEIGFFTTKGTTKSRLDTFPNSLIYSKASEADNIQSIYNGILGININGTNILPAWDLLRHYRVSNAQKSVLTAASGTGNAWDQSTWDTMNWGFAPLSPSIEFEGQAKNSLSIVMPAAVDLSPATGSNYGVIILRGLLIQNAGKGVQQ